MVNLQRFHRHVEQGDDCWTWTGAKTEKGYGLLNSGGRKGLRAHRVAYTIWVGPIPEGLQVLHRCDNPSCVRPDHLFLGTNADNMADKCEKGRQARQKGDAHPRAKLTEADVIQIRQRYAAGGTTHKELAAAFGVKSTAIREVVQRKKWAHVA